MKEFVVEFLEVAVRFAELFKQSKEKFAAYESLVNKSEKATQDILHKMELDNLSRQDKVKFATKLAHVRKDRRYFKDKVDALKDLMAKFEGYGPSFVGNVNKMADTAAVSFKKYQNRKNRKYTPRVIEDLVIESQQKK